jgi:hypothetical protein
MANEHIEKCLIANVEEIISLHDEEKNKKSLKLR